MEKHLYLIGEINETLTQKVLEGIHSEDWKEVDELHVWISTSGGYIRDCFGIIDLLTEFRDKAGVKLKTFGIGEVASAGFFLFILGEERIISPNCRIFVHEHMTISTDAQTFSEREKQDRNEKQILKMYVDYTASRLGISPQKTRGLLKKNKWLSLNEIQKYGIATNVVSKK